MDIFLVFAEWLGTVAFAMSGALKGLHKQLDLFGIFLLALITAMGGGVLRDVLLGKTPPQMFFSADYVVVSLAVSVAMFYVYKYYHRLLDLGAWGDWVFCICDAIGLGVFAVIGTQTAMEEGYSSNLFICLFMATITGVGGGVLRDMMCQEIPSVFVRHIYALAAAAGGLLYYILVLINASEVPAAIISTVFTVSIRVLAKYYRWNLPRIRDKE